MNKKFYDNLNGEAIYLYTISNENIAVSICNLGASIYSFLVNGIDIVLGFNTIDELFQSESFSGATMGRVANRISNGRFVLNGRPYFLNENSGTNHLHGGYVGFDKRVFDVIAFTGSSITLQYVSCDNEERYPGKLTLTVVYTVSNNSLLIEYIAISDKDTLWFPTNHAYFNLDGEDSGDCRNNLLQLNADFYTPVDEKLIPTGEKHIVGGTIFDFRKLKAIGQDFCKSELSFTNGYDHNFILNGNYAAHAESTKTGITLDLYTDLPCLQFYTSGALNICEGKTINYGKWAGYCLEPQFCPNAVNMNGFDKPVIRKNIPYNHYIKYVLNNSKEFK